jgi:hypothetical protein
MRFIVDVIGTLVSIVILAWVAWYAGGQLLAGIGWAAIYYVLYPHEMQAGAAFLIFGIILALIYRSTRI